MFGHLGKSVSTGEGEKLYSDPKEWGNYRDIESAEESLGKCLQRFF